MGSRTLLGAAADASADARTGRFANRHRRLGDGNGRNRVSLGKRRELSRRLFPRLYANYREDGRRTEVCRACQHHPSGYECSVL
ncbi:MAG: hypothetical protein ILA04_01175 [Prevotella sp.]|nr:hypothetical protein [Prevotella sp.]